MAENKTKPTGASVDDHLAAVASAEQLADCQVLIKLMRKVTRQQPTMWGPSIVGFGSYHYRYASGREGDSCLTGFAVRGRELVVYLMPGASDPEQLLSRLGKYRMGKACLYIRRLSDVDINVLETLVAESVTGIKRLYGKK